MWITDDELVGFRVTIYTDYGEEESAIVLAVSDSTTNIRVMADDGTVMVGNQYDELD